MQVQNPCSIHQNYQITSACVSKDCQLPSIFCDTCLKNHDSHNVIKYNQFYQRYQQFQQINQSKIKQIRNLFQRVNNTFNLCIKRAEERIMKQYTPCAGMSLPKLDSIQSQQLWGIASKVCKNQKFQALVTGIMNITKLNVQQNKLVQSLSTNIDQLNTNMMTLINKFMSNIQINKISNSSIKLVPQTYYFNFVQKFSPKIYQISDNGQIIARNTTINEGLSMYSVVDKPLNKQIDTISFKIIQQQKRFIYFGVCDVDTFRGFGFQGPLYEKGNKMYSIRQSIQQGGNAISLHNSLDQYSNKDKVPWDYRIGDCITIKYACTKNSIIFIKNQKQTFQMPLDKSTTKFYPFVGLKFNKDKVKIVYENNLINPQKKKSMFGNLLSSFM